MEMNENNLNQSDVMVNHSPEEEKFEVKDEDANTPIQDSEQSFRYAGFWMRFWAYLLDLIVVGSIERLLVKPLFRLLEIPLGEFNMFAPFSIASAIIFYLYFVLMTKYFKQTIGKMVFGIKVIDLKKDQLSWGTILFREWIGRFISVTIVIGYIIVAFLPKKQGLHDLFSDTTVIHVER
ncbi:RDD family protein [Neobacillus sp. K501]